MVVLMAVTPVETKGVNLSAVLAIVIPIASTLIGLVAYLDVRSARREAKRERNAENLQKEFKDDITSAVGHLGELLLERLETKEAVSAVRMEVGKMGVELAMLKDEITRYTHGTPNPT